MTICYVDMHLCCSDLNENGIGRWVILFHMQYNIPLRPFALPACLLPTLLALEVMTRCVCPA